MNKIKVSFRGCPYGPDSLKGSGNINGIVGIFDTILNATQNAEKYMKDWISSYTKNNIGIRPISSYSRITSWKDPSKVEMFACGGWGDSIFMTYKFEFA